MLSMAHQHNVNASVKTPTFSSQSLIKPLKPSILSIPKTSCSELLSRCAPRMTHCPRDVKFKLSASSSAPDAIVSEELPSDDSIQEKLGVVVKPIEKPRLVLQFIWMQKSIGIALNQIIPGYGTIPLSPYYFWPGKEDPVQTDVNEEKRDAWEELKLLLESKPWISSTQRIHLLNQVTDIINLWQHGVGNSS